MRPDDNLLRVGGHEGPAEGRKVLKDRKNWKMTALLSAVLLLAFSASAWITGLWVLTAVPIGFLFGFFLEKAELCGSSAFSEAFMMRDWRKLQGIWVVAVVSMLGFALISGLGLVKLNPKPLLWASYIAGGLVFGIGMVLAGGCVSGSLFKTGQGNLNSMAALVGIPLGVAAAEHGPLSGIHKALGAHVVKGAEGGPITLFSIVGLPYWLLALVMAAITLAAALYLRRRKSGQRLHAEPSNIPFMTRVLTRPWKPWHAGILIGILASLAYLSSAASGRNYPLGVTHGPMHVGLLITETSLTHIYAPRPSPPVAATAEQEQTGQKPSGAQPVVAKTPREGSKKVSWWLMLEVCALVLGSFVSARLTGRARLSPKPPEQIVVAFFGGLMVGVGAAIAGGCVVGNIMSGLALMSVGNAIFAAVVLLANWAATYFYMMGRQLPS